MKTELPVIENCEGCGACCLHMSVPPYDKEEIELLQQNLPEVYADFRAVQAMRELQLKLVGTDCVPCGFFDWITRKCRHHEHNPDICRRFEVGSIFCRNIRKDGGL